MESSTEGQDAPNVRSLFLEAMDRPAGPERAAYLDQACAENARLRARIEALLKAHERAGGFLKPVAFDPSTEPDQSPLTEGPGTIIGRYKLLERIGEGGMAVVYMAEQEQPIRRKVALKIIKLGMDTHQVIARFEAERQALALMDHPSIAKVLDAGATETGRPYFVMELVQGVSITEYCDRNNLSTKDRLGLFIQVCSAVQHAHTKGIIHRDIKPSNVMVTHHDGQPIPKVIDFGIAKATNQRLTEKTLFTRYAHLIGTPAYMSPEQAELSDLDIDTRTDIYSLGVLLYELLTGTTPFSEEELRKAGYVEMQRVIREQQPAKPSTRIRTAHVAQPPPAGGTKQPPSAGGTGITPEGGGATRRGLCCGKPLDGVTHVAQPPPAGGTGITPEGGGATRRGLCCGKPLDGVTHVAQPPPAGGTKQPPPAGGTKQPPSAGGTGISPEGGGATGVHGIPYQQVRGDLDWIVMKALEKDRARRYETASGLAEDVRRHIEHEPVMARGPSVTYRVERFLRRHRSQVILAVAVVVIAVAAGVVLSLWNRDRAQLAEAEDFKHRGILSQAREQHAKAERDAALETIKPILDSRHVGPEARLLQATILVDSRHPDEAAAILNNLLKERPEVAGAAHSLLARILWESESPDADTLKEIEEHHKQAETLLFGVPPSGGKDPSDPRERGTPSAEAYFLRAMTAPTIKEQLAALDRALELDSRHYESRRLRAFTYYASRKYGPMSEEAFAMQVLRDRDPVSHSLRATALRELGRYREAMAAYDRALKLVDKTDPRYVDLSIQRCETFLRMGDYERVIAVAQEGLRSFPDTPVFQYYIFSALTALGEYAKADTLFRRIVERTPTSRSEFRDWCDKYVFDTLEAGRFWHPADREPAGAAFLPMVEAEENYRQLSTKACCVIKDCHSGRWSPDGRKLAFSMGARGYSGVALYDTATKETELLIIPGKDPQWSPDGQFIAFARDCQVLPVEEFVTAERSGEDDPMPDEEVWIMNSDGSEPRRLAAGGYPSWGQDSTCVYYQSRVDQTFNSISIVDRDAEPRQITACSYGFPSVSPDGRRVAYLERNSLKVKDLDSQELVAQWPQPSATAMPGWSPTGDELCVGVCGAWYTSGLWIYRFDRREPVNVLGGPMRIRGSTWSPDRSKLVFHLGPPYCQFWSADLDRNVSTIDALAPTQTPEEYWRQMVRLCTRRIETDPLDAVAYSDRALWYDRLHERAKTDADMKRWSAVMSGRSPSDLDAPPARAELTFGEPTNLDAITQFFRTSPASPVFVAVNSLSSDSREMFVHSDLGGGQGRADIWVLKRAAPQEAWGPPENLGPTVNSPSSEYTASISGDGLELYFGSDRPGGHGNVDTYVTRRATRTSPWGPPTNPGLGVNSKYRDFGVWVSSDGSELYFTSNRPGGLGSFDVYVSKRATPQDPWGDPVNLGAAVNSPFNEQAPCLSPDGLLLVFLGTRPGGFGGVDLWMTRRVSRSAPWEPVVNLGPVISGPSNEYMPCLAPDGSALYFLRDYGDRPPVLLKAPILPMVDFDRDGKVGLGDLPLMVASQGTHDALCDGANREGDRRKVYIDDICLSPVSR
ncbi:MAG: protein kinase [Phycisphaerae bacterium]|nr:protein kinase [Phycisphaerae bacterium]